VNLDSEQQVSAADGRDGPGLRLLVPALISVGAMVSVISSLGAPLIPSIATANHVSLSTAQWVLTSALLTGALATPVMGRLADGPHQRHVILVTLTVVLVGSVLAAMSPTFLVLIIGRGLQGVGLGLIPVTMAIARSHLAPERAARVIALLAVTVATGAGLGFPITSLLAQVYDYHASFWFGALMVAGSIAVVWIVVPRTTDAESRPFDLIGALSLSVAVVGLLVVLSEGGDWGWTSATTLGILGVSAIVLAGWVLHELRVIDPLIDVRQVRMRPVLMADVSGFLIGTAMYLFLPVMVEFVQVPTSTGYGFGASILVAGFMMVPFSVGTFTASRFIDAYTRHFGMRSMIPFGTSLCAASILWFALLHTSLWQAYLAMGLVGVGLGFSWAAMPGFIIRSVPQSETGSATGLYQVIRSVGLSVGSACSAAILALYTVHGNSLPAVEGFKVALLAASGLCLMTALVSYALSGGKPTAAGRRPRHDEEEIEEIMVENAELGSSGISLAEEPLLGQQAHADHDLPRGGGRP
jgi:MFS family permease